MHVMPIDPVYNPQLPSTPVWTPSSAAVESHRSWRVGPSMRQGEASSWSALSVGLIAGAVAGAAIALVFAPRRGTELRSSMRHYASERGQQVSRMVQNGRSRAGDVVQRASSLIEQGRNALRTSTRWGTSGGSREGSRPLTASVAEISASDRRFEEPLGG
jgi:gas vesicle protein